MKWIETKMKLGLSWLTIVAVGCASHPHQPNHKAAEDLRPNQEVEAASPLNRSVVSTITFAKGQKGLSPEAASEIQKALADARRIGAIKTVEVAEFHDRIGTHA